MIWQVLKELFGSYTENRPYGNMGEIREIDQGAIEIVQVRTDNSADDVSGSGEKDQILVIKFSEGRVVRICLWTGCKN